MVTCFFAHGEVPVRHVVHSFVEFTHGIEHQVSGRSQHGALQGSCAVNKFVDAVAALHALQDVDDGFVSEQIATFGVRDFAGIEKQQRVGFAGVDVQRTGLARMAKHLHHAGQVMMLQAAAEAGVGLRQHLRGKKSIGFADDNLFDVRGDGGGGRCLSI